MTEPEIARRCLSCGASVRHRASFCPQCGQVLEQRESDPNVEQPDEEPPPPDVTQPIITQTAPHDPVPLALETKPLIQKPLQRPPTVEELPDRPTAPMPKPTVVGLPDHTMGRVERIKKVSTVMIDQAAYDPSLRFLLVAAGLFILFVILMILSKVIG